MISRLKAAGLVLTIISVGMVSGCGGSGSGSGTTLQSATAGTSGTAASASSAQLSAGAELYASNCATCHGAITTTSIVTPTTIAKIKGAIAANTGGMGMFSAMSDVNLQLIADAVNNPAASTSPTPAPVPTPTPVFDGAAYYTANCAGCHGALASSAKLGATAAQIQAGIASVSGMSSFSSLTSAQIQAIATALAPASTPTPTPTPTPAPTFNALTYYNTTCLGCHGSLGVRTAAQIQAAINSNRGGMGSLGLTAAQVAAIAAVSH
jgi:mono/diheme cytochrome c family protein